MEVLYDFIGKDLIRKITDKWSMFQQAMFDYPRYMEVYYPMGFNGFHDISMGFNGN